MSPFLKKRLSKSYLLFITFLFEISIVAAVNFMYLRMYHNYYLILFLIYFLISNENLYSDNAISINYDIAKNKDFLSFFHYLVAMALILVY